MSYLATVRIVFVTLVLCAFSTTAQSTLMIDVTGAPGSGTTTWLFSGAAMAEGDGTVRTETVDSFNLDDTFDVIRPGGPGSFITDPSIQWELFPLMSGSASLTIGADTRSILALLLNEHSPRSEDQLGIRVDSSLDYLAGETSSWSGSLLIGVDINQLSEGTFINQRFLNPEPNFAGPAGDVLMTVTSTAVPEPTTFALLVLGLVGLRSGRRYL